MSDVKIRVGTTGTDEARRDLTRVGAAAKTAKDGAMSAQQGFSAASSAASAAGGSFQSITSALGQMLPAFKGLQAALPTVGLVMAAFSAWKRVVDELTESQQRLAKSIREIQAGNLAGKVDMLAQAYKRATEEISRTGTAIQGTLALSDALASARERQAAADLRLAKAAALEGVSDPAERERIEKAYAKAAAEDAAASAARKSAAEDSALHFARQQAAGEVAAREARLDELTGLLAEAITRQNEIIAHQESYAAGGLTPKQQEDRRKAIEPEIQQQAATIQKLGTQIEALRGELQRARDAAAAIEDRRKVHSAEAAAIESEAAAGIAEAGGKAGDAPAAGDGKTLSDMRARIAALQAEKDRLEHQAEINTGRAAEILAQMAADTQGKIDSLVTAMSAQLSRLGQAVADQAARIASLPSP